MTSIDGFGELIEALPEIPSAHARTTGTYALLDGYLREAVAGSVFAATDPTDGTLGPVGDLVFPYEEMGAVTSLDLFGLDEMIIFAFYWTNRDRYKHVADIGANLGLHTLIMARCGFKVTAYEPDPKHLQLLQRNVELNGLEDQVNVVEAAVSDTEGTAEFVRVLGNTTSSHLSGAKESYGQLETLEVNVSAIQQIMETNDLIKLDIEGQEAEIICSTDAADWVATDMICEVGTSGNASRIFEHISKIGLRGFSQKRGWRQALGVADVPTGYAEGSFFITKREAMPW